MYWIQYEFQNKRIIHSCGLFTGIHFNDTEVKQLVIWETQNTADYIRETRANELTTLENRVRETNER